MESWHLSPKEWKVSKINSISFAERVGREGSPREGRETYSKVILASFYNTIMHQLSRGGLKERDSSSSLSQ
jgi:hypothetical protein